MRTWRLIPSVLLIALAAVETHAAFYSSRRGADPIWEGVVASAIYLMPLFLIAWAIWKSKRVVWTYCVVGIVVGSGAFIYSVYYTERDPSGVVLLFIPLLVQWVGAFVYLLSSSEAVK